MALAGLALPLQAQPAPEAPAAEAAQADEPAAPEAPALAPPPAARLAPGAGPATPEASLPAAPTGPLPGLEQRAEGGWRLRFPAGTSQALPAGAQATLGSLARRLATQPTGRVTLVAQAAGPAEDASAARRLSLARGIAVKEALAAGGLAATRIDIRPLGRTEEVVDAVDVLPPGTARPAR